MHRIVICLGRPEKAIICWDNLRSHLRRERCQACTRWARRIVVVFSGIIEDLGTVKTLKPTDKGALITIGTRLPGARIKVGDSIACNGACLTVVAKGRGALSMDVSAETLRRTALGGLKPADPINVERSLTLGTLL